MDDSGSGVAMSDTSVARRDTAVTAILCYGKGFACACGLGTVHLFERSDEDYFHPLRSVTVMLCRPVNRPTTENQDLIYTAL